MSSSLNQDIDQCVPAAIEWEYGQQLHHIAEPDPRGHNITLDIRFCAETSCTLFKLYFPIYLKGFANLSQICILIDPPSLESLTYTFNPTIPDAVRKKLNCKTVRLGFRPKPERNLVIIAPTSANEPLTPTRAQSGKVLDAIRMLSGVTSCGVYVEASKVPLSALQVVSEAVNRGHLKPLSYDLNSMFGGIGGKTIQFSAHQNDAPPPSYNEAESQSAPCNPKKRLRQNSQASSTDFLASILAELKELRIAHSLIQSENARLKERLEAVESDVEQLQGDNHHASMKLESVDGRLLELDENLEGLTQRVEAIEEYNQDSDDKTKLKNEIIDEIATRLLMKIYYDHDMNNEAIKT
ncbi:hypothetical protein AU210_016489 [Fusarium oxysporum f. sp. radicis-cucumerinum]|uniref:Uncharacterized protein n=1 Tax=Fusarium oxysporum f. sp. radicis-cucumerinum TaxID=327505 RepID=A0A2H3G8X8_FUSOX|nr:hypothetical protein AU210_016489 [Fusarium oxysporum f. sp. radicis-cucumerinum]